MNLLARLSCTAAMASFALGQPAFADVSADDVWTNIKAYLDTFGGKPETTIERSSNGVSVGPITMSWDLPEDAGTFTLTQSGFDLVQNDDGTVDVQYPATQSVTMRAEITDEGTYAGTVDVTSTNLNISASGLPGEISYAYSADQLDFAVRDVEFEDVQSEGLTIGGTARDLSGTASIAASSLVTVNGQMQLGANEFNADYTDTAGARSVFSGTAQGLTASHEMLLPRSGISFFNLADAMERGLRFSGESSLDGYRSEQTITLDGAPVSHQLSESDTYDTSFSLNRERLQVAALMENTRFSFSAPDAIPFPISAIIARNTASATLPISAGETLQDAALSLDMTGLEIPEQLWGMVDPTREIPRDPMALSLALNAKVKSFWDWFDFADVAARGEAGELPGELHAVTLENFRLKAAGAELTGMGEASFDNSDTTTYAGFPKPTGVLDLTLRGGNTLLDRLVKIGILPEQQAMAARMMVGMVAKPDDSAGEDVLNSHLEFTEDGELLANGMRMR
ncbi:DUF2125 domain-containing protein [Phaeobacter sp. 22II1-1F12B]|uniref:DUF2125 domain-containing protein n=1 Tax=Phaeobacter sp. 22II1-1F12B TaxID=1317111 RepID=UPI000B523B3F|nr:DUF2125 domain-containing protein [Phaeobacter sp. 22II1-1F12B]